MPSTASPPALATRYATPVIREMRWQWADETARLADTGFTSDDVGRYGVQESDHTEWRLVDTAPTWAAATDIEQDVRDAASDAASAVTAAAAAAADAATALTAAGSAASAASAAQSTADGAETHAQTGIANAAAAQSTATSAASAASAAQSTATSAASAASAAQSTATSAASAAAAAQSTASSAASAASAAQSTATSAASAASAAQADIDAHEADTANPHVVTASQVGAPPTSRQISTGSGLTGGGNLSADRTLSCSFGTTSGTVCEGNDTRVANAVQTSRQVIAGTGLTGGGTLAADRTLAVSFGTNGTTACVGNDSRLSDSRTPTAHASTHQNGGSDEIATATAGANAIPKAGAGGTLAIGWIPVGATSATVCVGNDSRLSDSRAPTGSAGGSLAGTYPNPTLAKNLAYANEITTGLTLGTTQPLSLADSIFTGKSAQATANLASASPVTGIAAGAFASSGAEIGTSTAQGGLGSSAASNQPYNSTDFPGYRKARVLILKLDDDQLTLVDVVPATTGADVDAPVYGYLAYRSDLGADAKWRLWFYYRRNSDGLEVPVTPTASVTSAKLYVVEVMSLDNLPGSALISRSIAGQLPGEVAFGAVGDIADLGTKAAGSTGRVADAGHIHAIATATPAALGVAAVGTATKPAREDHVHVMPRLDQVSAPNAAVAFNAQKATGMANGTVATDGATCGQIVPFWTWGATATPGSTTTSFLNSGAHGTAVSATETVSRVLSGVARTITGLYVSHNVALTTDSVTYTLRVNGVDTAITFTIAANATANSITGQSVSVVATDILTLKIVQSSSQSGATVAPRATVIGKLAA